MTWNVPGASTLKYITVISRSVLGYPHFYVYGLLQAGQKEQEPQRALAPARHPSIQMTITCARCTQPDILKWSHHCVVMHRRSADLDMQRLEE